jgi:hypothetical protein
LRAFKAATAFRDGDQTVEDLANHTIGKELLFVKFFSPLRNPCCKSRNGIDGEDAGENARITRQPTLKRRSGA